MPALDLASTFPSPTRMLTAALMATLLAAVVVSSAGGWAVAESLEKSAEIARREERTAYLVSSVARDTSRIRAALLEAITEPEVSPASELERTRAIAERIKGARSALPPLLGVEERAIWHDVEPRLDRMLMRYDQAIFAIEGGAHLGAERILDDGIEDSLRLDADIDRFQEVSLGETEVAVANVKDHTAHTLELVSLVKVVLLAAMVFAWILVLRIVAGQRRALAVQIERLETSNRDLEAFAGRVAHDMRNVLAPIQLSTAVMTASGAEDRLPEIAGRIDRSCARGRELVDGLLAFSRAAEPGTELGEPCAVVDRELEDVLDQVDGSIRAADVEVTIRVPSGLEVALPRALLHAVLLNLADNAVKFMRGRTERRLTIQARASPRTIVLSIRDTGPGIPEHERSRVFDALYRGAGSRGEGAGLGLATVKRIVESHGGRIELGATGTSGTTFVVHLPRAATARAEATPQISTIKPEPAT
jgi:signal transduction histidine kinase